MNTSMKSGKTSNFGSDAHDDDDSDISGKTRGFANDPVFKELDECFQVMPDQFNQMR